MRSDCARLHPSDSPGCLIRGRVSLASVLHSDGWRGLNGLMDLGFQKDIRVNHGENEFANQHCHTVLKVS